MTIRFGVHAQSGERIREMRPGLIHWVDVGPRDLMAEARGWGCVNVARRWVNEGEMWGNIASRPEWAASWYWGQWWERFSPAKDFIDYVIGPNEVWGSDKPEWWQAEAMHRCDMALMELCHSKGLKFGGSPWPVGNPSMAQVAMRFELAREDGVPWAADAQALNEYWCTAGGPRARDGAWDPKAEYLVGRWSWWPQKPPVPLIMPEVGFDRSAWPGAPKEGWTKWYTMENRDQVYADHLADYCRFTAELAEQKRVTVIGAAAFTTGRDRLWVERGYDFTGIWQIEKAMREWPKEHTVYEQEVIPMPYEFTLGFKTFAEQHPAVGEAAGPLEYDAFGNAMQLTSIGELRWWKAVNKITFIAHDARQPDPLP